MRKIFVSLAVAAAACGGGSGNGQMDAPAVTDTTAPTTTASHPAGVYRVLPSVTLTSDETATIYYTTDGTAPTTASTSGASPVNVTLTATSTLKFYAVDTAGNAEAPHSLVFTLDRLGPIAVAHLHAAASGSDVALTWDNPTATGFTGVVIARVDDVATTNPTSGAAPAVGATLGAGNVIYVGNGTSFTDPAPGHGRFTYLAWAHYDTLEYSEGRASGARIAEPTQTCQLTIDMTAGTPTTTVDTQPGDFVIAAANTTLGTGTVSVELTVTSHLAGVTPNPRFVVKTLSGTPTSTLSLVQSALSGTDPYADLGPAAVFKNGAAVKTITINSSVSSVITVGCEIQHGPAIYTSAWCASLTEHDVTDAATGFSRGAFPQPPQTHTTAAKTCTSWRGFALSPDERYLYLASRTSGDISKLDTTTLTIAAGLAVATTAAQIGITSLALDPSGRRLYAAINDGGHGGTNFRADLTSKPALAPATQEALLLEIDTSAMTESHRLSLGTGDWLRRANRVILSPDGRMIAVPIGGSYNTATPKELHVVDVSPWSERDYDAGTAGIQGAAIGTQKASNGAFSEDNAHLLVNNSYDVIAEQVLVGIVDTATGVMTTVDTTSVGSRNGGVSPKAVGFLADGPDRFWLYGDYHYPVYLTPSTGLLTTFNTITVLPSMVNSATIGEDGNLYLLPTNNSTVTVRDRTTGAEVRTFNLGRSFQGHAVAMAW